MSFFAISGVSDISYILFFKPWERYTIYLMVIDETISIMGKTLKRNIVEDYENIFGKTPPRTPIAILILNDADETRSYIVADYDNFELRPDNESSANYAELIVCGLIDVKPEMTGRF